MDWISGIQNAINYMEDHLLDETDYKKISNQAYSSVFHFQRIFSMLCGYTISDYIRMRRMSLAAEELIQTNNRVIDIALKYCYDTPESFSRAFTRFHGVTPSEARHGKRVKSFSRLSVKLILNGGIFMDYRIKKLESFKVVCKKQQVNKPQGDTATADISAFWNKCNNDRSIQQICKYGDFSELNGILGLCFSSEMANGGFPYGIGAVWNGESIRDKNLDIVEIPEYLYAVFDVKGKMPDAFIETYKKICTEFFPQNNKYEYGNGLEIEVYPSADTQNPNYSCQIWIAIKEKKVN